MEWRRGRRRWVGVAAVGWSGGGGRRRWVGMAREVTRPGVERVTPGTGEGGGPPWGGQGYQALRPSGRRAWGGDRRVEVEARARASRILRRSSSSGGDGRGELQARAPRSLPVDVDVHWK